MKRRYWIYCTSHVNTMHAVPAELEKLGSQGWELVGVLPQVVGFFLIFKQEDPDR